MPLFPKLFTFHSTSEDEAIKRHVDLKTKEIAAAMSEEMERRLEALEEALSQKLSDMERRHSEQTRQLLDALAAAKTNPKQPVEVEVRTGPVEVEVEPMEEGMHAAALALAPVPAKPRALSIPERMALDDQKHATMIMQKVQRGKAERSKIARSQWRRAFTAAKEMAKAEKQVSPQPVKERPPRLRGEENAATTGPPSPNPMAPAATPPTAAPLLTRIAPAPAPTAAATELKKLPMESVRSTAETGGVGILSPKGEKPMIPKTKVFL